MREFVGADRAIRRLAVTPVTERLLGPRTPGREEGTPEVVALGASLYDALAAMLTAGSDRVLVTGDAGKPLGHLTREALFD